MTKVRQYQCIWEPFYREQQLSQCKITWAGAHQIVFLPCKLLGYIFTYFYACEICNVTVSFIASLKIFGKKCHCFSKYTYSLYNIRKLVCLNYVCHHIDCILKLEDSIHVRPTKHQLLKSLELGRYGQQPIRYVFYMDLADSIRILYDAHVDDFKISKVSKSIILNFNIKMNVWGWFKKWIKQILVLKQNDHMYSMYHSFIHKVFSSTLSRSNLICMGPLSNCIKVKCEIILSDVSVQHDDRIDTYRLISVPIVTVSSQPYKAHVMFVQLK